LRSDAFPLLPTEYLMFHSEFEIRRSLLPAQIHTESNFLSTKLPRYLFVAAFLAVGLLLPTSAQAANYYINAAGARGDGSGSSADNAADASTPDKYRTINQTQTAPGTVIVYAPGTYLVYPAYSMANGVTHQGSGIDSTIIKLPDGASSGTFTPMWLADKGTISHFKFFDATFDFNANHQAWWSKGTGCSMAFAFSTADHCTIQRIKFINIGAKNEEAFPVFFIHAGSAKGVLKNNLVDSCIFTQPIAHGNTKGGLTCIMMSDAAPKITVDNTNIVSNCQFLKLKAPEYSDLPYSQCCTCPVAINNRATGVDSLWFIEPGSQAMGNNAVFCGQTVQVTGNTLVDSGAVAQILMHPNGNFAGDLNVQNNRVELTEHPYFIQGPRGPAGVAIEQYWPGNPPLGNITVRDNTFIAPLPKKNSPRIVSANVFGSGKFFHLASLTATNNTLVNFPQDGKELNVTTDPACNPRYTHTGNTFAPASHP
jgi:hypothetical protein